MTATRWQNSKLYANVRDSGKLAEQWKYHGVPIKTGGVP